MKLIKKSAVGAAWTLFDVVVNKAIFFISTLVLSRILDPADFGVLGMIMVFFAVGTALIDSGLSVSIIRSNRPTDVEYSTVFYLNLILSVLAYLVIYVSAPFIADFYNQEILISLIRVYCIGFVISAFRIIPVAVLVKNMNFKSIAIYNMPGNLVGFIVGVLMAQHGFKVWSIVGLFLSTQIVSTMVYFFFGKWKPVWRFSRKYARAHWNFGYKLMISTQINIVFENVYNVLIGRYFSVQTLGQYERAYTLSNYPMSILTIVSNKISLPLFSQMTNDIVQTRSTFRRVLLFSLFLSTPLLLGAIVVAEPLIYVVLGNKWGPAVTIFQVLCLSYVWYPIHSLNINILSVAGRSDLFLKLEVLKKVLLMISVVTGFSFGINGLVWSSVAASTLSLLLNTHYSGKIFGYGGKHQLLDFIPTLSISVITAVGLYLSKSFLIGYDPHLVLMMLVSEGLLLYLALSIITKNESFFELLRVVKLSRGL